MLEWYLTQPVTFLLSFEDFLLPQVVTQIYLGYVAQGEYVATKYPRLTQTVFTTEFLNRSSIFIAVLGVLGPLGGQSSDESPSSCPSLENHLLYATCCGIYCQL